MKYTKEQVIENIKLIAEDLGHPPSAKEYGRHEKRLCSLYTLITRWGFSKIIRAAGLKPDVSNTFVSREEIIIRFRKMVQELGHFPSISEFERHSKYSVSFPTVKKRFGSLQALKDIVKGEKKSLFRISTDTLLQDLYLAALHNPEVHSISTLISKYTRHSVRTYRRQFHSLRETKQRLTQKYGLKIVAPVREKQIDRQVILDEFFRVKEELGRAPLWRELVRLSRYRGLNGLVNLCFGSYTKMLNAINMVPYRINKYTQENLEDTRRYYIGKLREVARNRGRLNATEAYKLCNVSHSKIYYLFGSGRNWFAAAKMKKHYRFQPKRYSDDQILESLKATAGDSLYVTMKQYSQSPFKIVSANTISVRFNGWDKALKTAGLK